MAQLKRVALQLIDASSSADSLRPEVLELASILADSRTIRTARHDDISDGETRTSRGLALSPTMAVMCADDYLRTIQFIRGTHDAIKDLQERVTDRPVRVLYVGCGPYATLAVPLMVLFSPAEVVFTLLDIHDESIESAKSILRTLGQTDSVSSFETIDAGLYQISPAAPPDIILMEIMQACLESEPQVALTRHLLEQAPNAVLIPEEVKIDLALVDPSCEFDLHALNEIRLPTQRNRIPIASVFTLNRDTAKAWSDNDTDTLPAGVVQMPEHLEQRYDPMLFTLIRVYKDHLLRDYDSGLTCPRRLSVEGDIGRGDTIQFRYRLGSRPGLIAEVSSRPH